MMVWRTAAASYFAMAIVISPAWSEPGDAEQGKSVFAVRCSECHNIETSEHKIGPTLIGLWGRTSGTIEGYAFSDAMKAAGIIWSPETLQVYLKSPRTVVPKTKMNFNGIKRPGEMENLLAYLRAELN